ncbi:unnamed protein product [Medioppia subpectinata]|uniref:Aromatic-L-amino-acid decarboxylase n=1 Tax=Medioppia subpectinata TaxID=1979941 RepID=A0A7R9KFJ4_9ACAR|nr:unnamed protein product [Medioppia subpectinata]CAG2102621.1 unnamed protein product [Medioppia subpectinata]
MDATEFRSAGKQLVDWIADYLENIRERPVFPSVKPGYIKQYIPETAPESGESWSAIFADIDRVIMPGITHFQSPHFYAYFPVLTSFPSICADMLSSALGVIGITWISSPVATELEMQMMDWLAKMLTLPNHFTFSNGGKGGGVILGSASEAILMSLLGARSKILADHGHNKELITKLVAYASDQSHSSVERAALLGAVQIKLLPTFAHQNHSLRGDVLREQIKKDKANGLIPFFVVATLGTTGILAFDNITEVGKVCEEENVWLHIDAAFAGSAFICPEFRHHLNGIEYVSSINVNPHKWLLINLDCSALWLKNRDYIVDAFNVNPVYLRHEYEGQMPDFRQVALAKYFQSLLLKDDRFELSAPVEMSLVTFRLKGTNALNEKFHKLINDGKAIHLTPTRVGGQFIIRFIVCSQNTEDRDIEFAWNEIQKHAFIALTL